MQRYRSYKMIMVAVLVSAAALPAIAQQAPALPPLPMPAVSGGVPEITLPQLPDPAGAAATPTLPPIGTTTPDPVAPPAPVVPMPAANDAPSAAANTPPPPTATDTVAGTQTPAPIAEQKKFSFGSSDLSLFFQPAQISKMKDAIVVYESVNRDAKPKFEETKPVGPAPVVMDVKEPDTYPVFFLSSIVYDGPADWSIWIGGAKITSRKNETDVQVLSVSRDTATLAWRPDYAEAVAKRRSTKQFAVTDAVKNKLAVVQRVSHDPQTGLITFTLRQNQSFAVGYFSVFEGYVDSPKLASLIAMAPTNDLGVNGPASPVDAVMGMPPGQGAMNPDPSSNPEMPPSNMPSLPPTPQAPSPPTPAIAPMAPVAPPGIQ